MSKLNSSIDGVYLIRQRIDNRLSAVIIAVCLSEDDAIVDCDRMKKLMLDAGYDNYDFFYEYRVISF